MMAEAFLKKPDHRLGRSLGPAHPNQVGGLGLWKVVDSLSQGYRCQVPDSLVRVHSRDFIITFTIKQGDQFLPRSYLPGCKLQAGYLICEA